MPEFNLDRVGTAPIKQRHSVGDNDTSDTFGFRVDSDRSINVSLMGMSADADLSLYRDENYNGVIDVGIDTRLGESTGLENSDEAINVRGGPGHYIAEVSRFGNANTSYDFIVSATKPLQSSLDDPSNLVPREIRVGTIDRDMSYSDSIGDNDTADVYRFTLDRGSVGLSLTGLSADADIRLIRDSSNKGIVDAGEEVSRSYGTSDEFLNVSTPGDYLLQVYQFRFGESTDYTLNFDSSLA